MRQPTNETNFLSIISIAIVGAMVMLAIAMVALLAGTLNLLLKIIGEYDLNERLEIRRSKKQIRSAR